MKNKSKRAMPTTAELFQGTRSQVAFSAIFRTGGGTHADRRKVKSRKGEWKKDAWA